MPREAFDGIGEREKRLENRLMRQLNRSKPREERLKPCRREWRKMLRQRSSLKRKIGRQNSLQRPLESKLPSKRR